MELRINDAMNLQNARIEAGKSKGNKITRQTLGNAIYPKSSHTCVRVSMSNLLSGLKKKLNPDWVVVICNECNVDPNFLYGVGKSKFNKEFESYFGENK